MRVAVLCLGQETNDINLVPATVRDFEAFGVFGGSGTFARLRGPGEMGGRLGAAEARRDGPAGPAPVLPRPSPRS